MSHRWDEPSAPDPSGVQLGAIRAHLRAHPQIKRVWLDYCCMPQGHARTESEQLAFGLMLRTNPNPNPNPNPNTNPNPNPSPNPNPNPNRNPNPNQA